METAIAIVTFHDRRTIHETGFETGRQRQRLYKPQPDGGRRACQKRPDYRTGVSPMLRTKSRGNQRSCQCNGKCFRVNALRNTGAMQPLRKNPTLCR